MWKYGFAVIFIKYECGTLLIWHLLSFESLQREISRQMNITPLRTKAFPFHLLFFLFTHVPGFHRGQVGWTGISPYGALGSRRKAEMCLEWDGLDCFHNGPLRSWLSSSQWLEEGSKFSDIGIQGPSPFDLLSSLLASPLTAFSLCLLG